MKTASSGIQWPRVAGVMAVQGAMTLAWVIYALYLPQLLTEMGLAKELAGTLLIIEHGLEMIIEPITGSLSDRAQWRLGTRFSIITPGIICASALFIAIPTVVIFGQSVKILLPIIAVLWASAMAIFRSPAIAILGKSAPTVQLPVAASFLTLIQQLVGALRFTVYGFILSLGAGFTFAIGSVVLLGAVAFLRWTVPPDIPQVGESSPLRRHEVIRLPIAILLIGVALGLGSGFRFTFAALGLHFQSFLEGDQVGWGMLGFSLVLALSALPAGKLATKLGNSVLMTCGAIATAVLMLGLVFLPVNTVWTISLVVMGFFLSAVLNGSVPLVLSVSPRDRIGLGLGLYFGAFSGGLNFFDVVFKPLKVSVLTQATGASLALLLAAVCIAGTRQLTRPQNAIAADLPSDLP